MSVQNNDFENKKESSEQQPRMRHAAPDEKVLRKTEKKNKKEKENKESKKSHKVRNVILIILGVLLAVIIATTAVFMMMSAKGKRELLNYDYLSITVPEKLNAVIGDGGRTVTYNGKKYSFNPDVASVVFLGVDKTELGTDTYGEAGQADAIFIFTYDTKAKKSKIISVSRDTMTDVNVYSESGASGRIENMQLCLAFSYGDGREKSCENMLNSLSRLFYNIPFSSYVALDLNAVAVLTEEMGGIEINLSEDFMGLPAGTKATLSGSDALSYLRFRDTSVLESNNSRIERQKQFISAFADKAVSQTKKDLTFPLHLYGLMSDYMVTNVTSNQVSYTASQVITSMNNMKDAEFLSIRGEVVAGEKYAEFHPDEKSLYELILDVFYTEMK